MRTKKGFTLVEILIVVVILGILAAIVIPQFSSASSEARMSSVQSNLQAVRSQVQLYKIQHGDQLPGLVAGVSFVQAMTQKTDVNGNLDAAGAYGPYLQKIPENPYTETSTVKEESGTATINTGTEGWLYDSDTGIFYANKGEAAMAAADLLAL